MSGQDGNDAAPVLRDAQPAGHDHDHDGHHDHDHHGHDDHDHDDHDHDGDHDHGVAPVPPPGPIAQSVTIGFLAIYAATLLLGLVWLASNARQIAPDTQAVVFRFGRIVRTQEAGLLLALPRPFEQVRLLPGPDRQLSETVRPLPPSGGIESPANDPGSTVPPGAAPYLTGDDYVVLLDATLIYRITDPEAYILAQDHVAAALDRLFRASADQVTAAHQLNDFLVVRASADGAPAATTELRGAVRDELLRDINARLAALASGGTPGSVTGLGVEVERIDMTAWLPPEAKVAFDAVLTATQEADQHVAAANTEAERRRQGAARERDRLLSAAQAAAAEAVTNAHVNTARILALRSQETPATRDSLVLQAYRAELADVMRRVGAVTLVDPKNGAHVILSGGQP